MITPPKLPARQAAGHAGNRRRAVAFIDGSTPQHQDVDAAVGRHAVATQGLGDPSHRLSAVLPGLAGALSSHATFAGVACFGGTSTEAGERPPCEFFVALHDADARFPTAGRCPPARVPLAALGEAGRRLSRDWLIETSGVPRSDGRALGRRADPARGDIPHVAESLRGQSAGNEVCLVLMPTCAGVRGGASGEVRIGRHFSEQQEDWMAALEDLKPNASIRGVLPTSAATVVSVQWFGSEAIELTYKDPGGQRAAIPPRRTATRRCCRDSSPRSTEPTILPARFRTNRANKFPGFPTVAERRILAFAFRQSQCPSSNELRQNKLIPLNGHGGSPAERRHAKRRSRIFLSR